MFKVAIIGRPNVGKSTLFNKLSGRNLAIVSDTAGTTRDVKDRLIEAGDKQFLLLDTAGLEKAKTGSIPARMTELTLAAIKKADLIVFLVDSRAPLTTEDLHFANLVHKSKKPVIFIANKAENKRAIADNLEEFARLGFGEPTLLSAEHNLGVKDLIAEISARVPYEEVEETDEDPSVRLAIIGRPNVGKSTLVNTLLGEEKMLTGDEAGLTRDSIDTDFYYKGRLVKLIDTAGLRKKAKVVEELEHAATSRSIESIKNSDVCIILIDAGQGLDKQDLQVGELAINEGKGLVIAVNKMDEIKDKKELADKITRRLATSFSQVKGIPVVEISALHKKGIDKLMRDAFELYDLRAMKITTSKLNKWLEKAVAKQAPPMSRLKRPMHLKYMVQTAVKPQGFTIFAGGASNPPDSYLRYLENSLKAEFGLGKVIIRLKIKTGNNPYKK